MSLFVSLSASSSTTLRHLRGGPFRRLPPVRLRAPLAQWRAHFHQSYHCFHSRTSKDSRPGQRPPSSHTISLNYNQCLVYVIIFRACSAMYAASKPMEITVLSLQPEPDLVISAPSSRVSVEVSKNKRLLVDKYARMLKSVILISDIFTSFFISSLPFFWQYTAGPAPERHLTVTKPPILLSAHGFGLCQHWLKLSYKEKLAYIFPLII